MSDHQTRLERDVYDHDHEDERPTPSGRRRGPVADWGVGDELFDQMPRRRFNRGEEPGRSVRDRRATESSDVPRGPVDDGRRTLRIGRDEDLPSDIAAVTADRDLGDDAGLAPEPTDPDARAARGDADPPSARVAPDDTDPPSARASWDDADPLAARVAWNDAEPPAPAPTDLPPRTSAGDPARRTVKIEGRPEGALPAARFHEGPQRLRPARSVGERVGARPERLAAWAFALGLLLILIAVLSSLL
jgi:hypothetical protein